MWNKKRILNELRRLREYWNKYNAPLGEIIDYILLHPSSVRRDFYSAVVNTDLLEYRSRK